MRPTRLLAFREHYDCSHGHVLDVWVRPRAPGAVVDPLRRCPTCDTLFVITREAPPPAPVRPGLEHDDDSCPNCRTPLSQSHEYPMLPRCPECAERIGTWLAEGPDLPASAASVVRCWAVSPAVIDLRDPVAAPAHRARGDARVAASR